MIEGEDDPLFWRGLLRGVINGVLPSLEVIRRTGSITEQARLIDSLEKVRAMTDHPSSVHTATMKIPQR